jgi:histidine ammonia-lyase
LNIASERLLKPGQLGLADFRAVLAGAVNYQLDPDTGVALDRNSSLLGVSATQAEAIYGLNTGFGKLAKTRIPGERLRHLQRNLVRSHAAGVGQQLPAPIVRLILLLKAGGLARGYSGVAASVVEALLTLLRCGITPRIPSKGSVGASGDLAPLAHLSLVLIGEGRAFIDGREVSGKVALSLAGLEPLVLGPKEGLALLNGTQVSTAIALTHVLEGIDLLRAGLAIGALSVDAARGSDTPFDPRLQELRGHAGQVDCAASLRALLAGSEIRASHVENDTRVQDPYCLRCQPQVIGACLDQLRYAYRTLSIEANAVTDNPIHLPDSQQLLSGGNFHAEPVAFAADAAAVAIAEIGALSERRCALLVDESLSGLPPFLTPDAGLHSGFMIAHVTAAALASENKTLAFPASVDSIPTSANQEDHVSMATHAAMRLGAMVENTRNILAIEWLAASQGTDFLAPLATSRPLTAFKAHLRDRVPSLGEDRVMSDDIERVAELLREGAALRSVAGQVPEVVDSRRQPQQ